LILETVAEAPGEVRLSEITRLLKKPTVNRLATDLVAKRIRERGWGCT
jgi:DNA-binding IclR family transcriptional regulator